MGIMTARVRTWWEASRSSLFADNRLAVAAGSADGGADERSVRAPAQFSTFSLRSDGLTTPPLGGANIELLT